MMLQQYLPLAVLKHIALCKLIPHPFQWLQQYLPLAVLKLYNFRISIYFSVRCNSTYRLRYWNCLVKIHSEEALNGCNSTYRLRYWNEKPVTDSEALPQSLQQYLPLAVLKLKLKNWLSKKLSQVATVPTACGIETNQDDLLAQLIFWLQQYLPLAVLKRKNFLMTRMKKM